jgi:hypothetical protein
MVQLQMFDGKTYDHQQDGRRLTTQLEQVRRIMNDGGWRTISEIAAKVIGTEAAISARLRDLRKEKFGGLNVERKRLHGGLWVYRVNHAS